MALHAGVLVDAIRARASGRNPGFGLASSFSKEAGAIPVYTPPVGGFLSASRADVPAGAIMTFDAIISTPAVDHDGDILESKGAVIDQSLALLWQHNPSQPIGRLVKVLSQTDQRITGRFAIADTDLGRDAAKLLEFGALRISHGFRPIAFTPLKDGRGYRVTKWNCLEVSLVSVPSNDQAIVTAFERLKLHSVQAKSYAADLKRSGGPCPHCDGAMERIAGRLVGGLVGGAPAKRKALRSALDAVQSALLQRAASCGPAPEPVCVCALRADGAKKLTTLARRLTAGLALGASLNLQTLAVLAGELRQGLEARRPVYFGIRPDTLDWRRTAYHEAGHAVAAVLLGVPVTEGVVGDKAADAAAVGRVSLGTGGAAAELLAVYLAGPAAEQWHGAPASELGSGDKKHAGRLFKELTGRKPSDDQFRWMTRDLAGCFHEHWTAEATRRVADLLGGSAGGVTSGEAIAATVRDAIGPFFAATVRDFRSKVLSIVSASVEQTKSIIKRGEKAACHS